MGILHVAASNNDLHILDFVLSSREVSVNVANKEGWTAAHLAGFFNNFDSLNLLLEYGADLSLTH